MKGFGAAITAISYYLPEKVVDNKSLVQEFGTWTEDKIYQKTGIRERHVVDGELVSDLRQGRRKSSLKNTAWTGRPSIFFSCALRVPITIFPPRRASCRTWWG